MIALLIAAVAFAALLTWLTVETREPRLLVYRPASWMMDSEVQRESESIRAAYRARGFRPPVILVVPAGSEIARIE